MKFVFLPEAEDDIERLYDFLIGQDNPVAAQKAMLAIDEGIQMLLETPYFGIGMEGRTELSPAFRSLRQKRLRSALSYPRGSRHACRRSRLAWTGTTRLISCR
ncbi:type II toxin-antitoxin system RelE/ParE family toxin [Rhizobium sp. R634]|uniref:type II toxin-antitoxin system RelE/ParE family toxin n=1 Tax=Rhizobium sp. R634 TaxID=1764274 RepID=UPI001FD900DE|nr:type II toxin-antitoxin system RelE/ParE family toxin [Rhizobium sp. R634]